MSYPAIPIEDRFWTKVDKSNECWIWTAASDLNGYGRVSYKRENHKAHRVAWILTYGDIPDDLAVCHYCDNPPCVRPDHLWIGTKEENWADMRAKGRGVAPPVHLGVKHHFAKLTDDQIAEIRELYATGDYYFYQLGEMFGVSNVSISNYVNGRFRCLR